MSYAFYIEGTTYPRPQSRRTVYVDGTANDDYRQGIDVELSHWIPNRTPESLKSGTSTQICFQFIQSNNILPYDLVVNNHLDMDGLLSVFVLTNPPIALKHQQVLCEAAAIGDFWAWSQGKALYLYQEINKFFQTVRLSLLDKQDQYAQCLSLVLKLLEDAQETCGASFILEGQGDLITKGKIKRDVFHDRLVSYFVPNAKDQAQAYLEIAPFDEPISERIVFWPHVRNRLDQEKIQLMAIEGEGGIYYDLWYPGYSWADTKGLWRPPGLEGEYTEPGCLPLDWPALSKVTQQLNEKEQGACTWSLYSYLDFGNKKNARNFPVVLSTLNEQGTSEVSLLPLSMVSEILRVGLCASLTL